MMEKRVIRGKTIEEQISSVDAALHRLRSSHGIGKKFLPTHDVILSGYDEDGLSARLYVGLSGKLELLDLFIDDIVVDADKKKLTTVQVQILGSDLKGLSRIALARAGRTVIAIKEDIAAGTKLQLSFDRPVYGVWYSFVMTPKLFNYKSIGQPKSEDADEGVQLSLE